MMANPDNIRLEGRAAARKRVTDAIDGIVRHATIYRAAPGEPWTAGAVYDDAADAQAAATEWVKEGRDRFVHVVGIVDTSGADEPATVAALVDCLNGFDLP